MTTIFRLFFACVVLGFSFDITADEIPPFKWVCSASSINGNGETESILNIEFIRDNQNNVTIFTSNSYAFIFQQHTNTLDHVAEYFVWIRENATGDELFRVYGNADAAFGLKWISQKLAIYCRPNF